MRRKLALLREAGKSVVDQFQIDSLKRRIAELETKLTSKRRGKRGDRPSMLVNRWEIASEINVGLPASVGSDARQKFKEDIEDRADRCPVRCDYVCPKTTVSVHVSLPWAKRPLKNPKCKMAMRLAEVRQRLCDAVAAVLGEDAVTATRRGEEVEVGTLPVSDEPAPCPSNGGDVVFGSDGPMFADPDEQTKSE